MNSLLENRFWNQPLNYNYLYRPQYIKKIDTQNHTTAEVVSEMFSQRHIS